MPGEEHIQYVPESPEVQTRIVLLCGLGVLVLLFAGIGILHAIYQHDVTFKSPPAPEMFPQPRVETSESETAERQRLAAQQRKGLETWRWVNDQHTLVQIPIERAMALLAERGGDAYAPLIPSEPALASPSAGAANVLTPSTPAKAESPREIQP